MDCVLVSNAYLPGNASLGSYFYLTPNVIYNGKDCTLRQIEGGPVLWTCKF